MAKSDGNIHAGHRERMRERFLQNGLQGFNEHEVLEMLLFYVIRRGDTNELAHHILTEFGSLHDVLTADKDTLCRVNGVGDNVEFYLRFLGAFHDYVEQSRIRNITMKTYENRCLYFRTKLMSCTDEHFLVACLDDDLKVIRCFTIARGAPGHVTIEMQTLARKVLSVHCSRIIMAHNHPKGRSVPSMEDISSTKTIAKTMKAIDIELIDHIVVGTDGACSMLKSGAYIPDMLG